jgi:hypothetical protein
MRSAPHIFISYTWTPSPGVDHETWKATVRSFADRLRSEGNFDVWLDQYDAFPPQGWQSWMRTQVRRATHILTVCNPAFRQRFEHGASRDVGMGVIYDGAVISRKLLEESRSARRFATVLLGSCQLEDIPTALSDLQTFQPEEQGGFDKLIQWCSTPAHVMPPPIGPRPKFV